MGSNRPILRLVGYLAARHQYGHDDRDVSNGFRDPEHTKPGYSGAPPEARRADMIRVNTGARNSLMGLEVKSDLEVEKVKSAFVELASAAGGSGGEPPAG